MAIRLRPSLSWLLAFIPVAFVLELRHAGAPLVFGAAALAIVPLAHLIVEGTEHLATHTGPAVGGLLNASFGNLPELIIAIVALRAGLFDMVRASLVGALLANLLLALGLAFLLGGLRHHEQIYSSTALQTYGAMMLLAIISLAVPASFHRFFGTETATPAAVRLDLGVAALLLVVYVLYLVLMLRTHRELFAPARKSTTAHTGPTWSVPRALGTLILASAGAAWMSEILVGAAESTGQALGLSDVFIGMIFLAIVGGAAESLSAIAAGMSNRMDLALGIAFGSCIQIALLVAPLLVLVSRLIAPGPFTLDFTRGEISALFIAVFIGVVVSSGGRSNWFKGVQLLAVYLIFAALAYLIP